MFGSRAFWRRSMENSGNDDLQQRQHQQRVGGGDQVVGHDAETVLDVFVEVAGRLRLGDVEEAEQHEGGQLPQPAGRCHQQDQPEGDDFVPDDAAVVGVTEGAAGDVDEPDAGQVGGGEQEQQLAVAEVRAEQDEAGPGEQRAEGAGRPRRQPAAAAAGEEVRRVGEQEAGAGRFTGQSDRIPCARCRPAGRPGRKR